MQRRLCLQKNCIKIIQTIQKKKLLKNKLLECIEDNELQGNL